MPTNAPPAAARTADQRRPRSGARHTNAAGSEPTAHAAARPPPARPRTAHRPTGPRSAPRARSATAPDETAPRERGRTSCRYWASASAAHGITVATARRRGGLPRIALPNRTWHTPEAAQLRRRRVRREIGHVQHRRLPAAQPPPVDHLEQRRVAERRPAIPCAASPPPSPRDHRRRRRTPAARPGSAAAGPACPRARTRAPRCSARGTPAPAPPRHAARTR